MSPQTLTSGFFTKGTYPRQCLYSHASCFRPTTFARRLPQPTSLPSSGHTAFTALQVLFGGPTTRRASLPTSLLAYRVAYPSITQEPDEFSWGHALIFRTVPPAHTLVRREDENAFASTVQARPVPVFGRPVHLDSRPRLRPGTSPQALRISPHGEHPALQWFVTTGQRGITPAFGYGAPHLSARGTLTLLIYAPPGAHYGPLRLPFPASRCISQEFCL